MKLTNLDFESRLRAEGFIQVWTPTGSRGWEHPTSRIYQFVRNKKSFSLQQKKPPGLWYTLQLYRTSKLTKQTMDRAIKRCHKLAEDHQRDAAILPPEKIVETLVASGFEELNYDVGRDERIPAYEGYTCRGEPGKKIPEVLMHPSSNYFRFRFNYSSLTIQRRTPEERWIKIDTLSYDVIGPEVLEEMRQTLLEEIEKFVEPPVEKIRLGMMRARQWMSSMRKAEFRAWAKSKGVEIDPSCTQEEMAYRAKDIMIPKGRRTSDPLDCPNSVPYPCYPSGTLSLKECQEEDILTISRGHFLVVKQGENARFWLAWHAASWTEEQTQKVYDFLWKKVKEDGPRYRAWQDKMIKLQQEMLEKKYGGTSKE